MSKRPAKLMISRAAMHAVYAEGEDAVISLLESLIEQFNALSAEFGALSDRLEALENQQSKDSHNSSQPPSGDGFGKRTKSLRPKSERPNGGQPGHPGETLEWCEQPQYEEVHLVERCQGCGESLVAVEAEGWTARQVFDVPTVELAVTEHQSEIKICPRCGVLNQGRFPTEASQTIQYGPNLKGRMVYLMEGQLLPSGRVCELLSDWFQVPLSEGTLYNVREYCYQALEPCESEVQQALIATKVVNFDETGVRAEGKLHWLHVAGTAQLTRYFVHPKRGQVAMNEMGILPNFKGVSVHDGLRAYAAYDCEHSLCNAHHLRELIFVHERYEQAWANPMIHLLVDMKRQVDVAKSAGASALSDGVIHALKQQYQAILDRGLAVNPPPPPPDPGQPKPRGRPKQSVPKNLLDRLNSQRTEVLRFLDDFDVPFDNNQAERDVRMTKLKQKISGTFRSMEGARQFCRIRGYISTLKKQGRDVLDALTQVFIGTPVSPLPLPE